MILKMRSILWYQNHTILSNLNYHHSQIKRKHPSLMCRGSRRNQGFNPLGPGQVVFGIIRAQYDINQLAMSFMSVCALLRHQFIVAFLSGIGFSSVGSEPDVTLNYISGYYASYANEQGKRTFSFEHLCFRVLSMFWVSTSTSLHAFQYILSVLRVSYCCIITLCRYIMLLRSYHHQCLAIASARAFTAAYAQPFLACYADGPVFVPGHC